MWILYAFASAIFAGVTAILAKVGIRHTDSNLATAIRTVIVLVFSWLMVFAAGSWDTIPSISGQTLFFLCLSGLATGASWLCYFRALQLGTANQVTPIDKSSTILTMLLACFFLGEPLTPFKWIGIAGIGFGTYLMISWKREERTSGRKWFFYAVLSAVFASLTSLLGKIGIQGVESKLGTAIRTIVVLVMAWVVVFVSRKQGEIRSIDRKSWAFLCLSGVTTGLSWLCYFRALQDGEASVVVPIDKLSVLVTVAFSYFFLKEKVSKRALAGLLLLTLGTLATLL